MSGTFDPNGAITLPTTGISGAGSGSGLDADKLDGITSTFLFDNMGQPHSTQTDFNAITDFGTRYVQGSTNGPGTGSSQFYGFSLGLGSEYTYSQYALQLAIPRYVSTDKYLSIRTREAGTWQAWSKISAGYADTAGDADTLDTINSLSFLRSDAADTAAGKITFSTPLARGGHSVGFFEGSYNNIGANSAKSNPIYTIGSSYNPGDATIGNMYGIGYSHDNFWYDILGEGESDAGWGFYVAADGNVRATISGSNGDIWSARDVTAGRNVKLSSTGYVHSGGDVIIRLGTA